MPPWDNSQLKDKPFKVQIMNPLQYKPLTPAETRPGPATQVDPGFGLPSRQKAVPAAAVKPYSSNYIRSAFQLTKPYNIK